MGTGSEAQQARTRPNGDDLVQSANASADPADCDDCVAGRRRGRHQIELQPINADKAPSRDLIELPRGNAAHQQPAAFAALKNSDLVLDLMLLLFSPEQMEILQSGTKILLAVEPPEVLVRVIPTEADRKRALGASQV